MVMRLIQRVSDFSRGFLDGICEPLPQDTRPEGIECRNRVRRAKKIVTGLIVALAIKGFMGLFA